jgi:hypothetical protein
MTTLAILVAAAEAFLGTHDRWAKQTEDELAYLKLRDVKSIEPLMKLRPQLEEGYQRQLKSLLDQREGLRALPDDVKARLKESQLQFAALSVEYLKELEITKRASERLISLIQKAATEQHVTSQFYGKTGAIKPHEPVRSITVNKKA